MRALSSSELLTAWEHGRGRAPAERALTLLAAARREEDAASLAEITVGRRDRDLLELRKATFGPRLVATARCRACGETAEVRFRCADVTTGPGHAPPSSLTVDGEALELRAPTCADLLAIGSEADVDAARLALVRRCTGRPELELPEEALSEIAARLSEADPQADVELELECPECGAAWSATFAIEAFLWSEIQARALGTLRDVHALAAAYGWSEGEILALSPERRHAYLELIEP